MCAFKSRVIAPMPRRRLDTLAKPLRPVPFAYRLHRRMDALNEMTRNPDRNLVSRSKTSSKLLPPLFLEPPVDSHAPPPPTCSIEADKAEAAAAALRIGNGGS